MIQGKIIAGIFLILFGVIQVMIPQKMTDIIKQNYKSNPLFKDKNQLKANPRFVVAFGVIWIIVGLMVILFGH